MTRSFGLVFVLVSVALGGYLYSAQGKTTTDVSQRAETQATAFASGASFDAALPTIQLWYDDHGTYAGLSLPPVYGVTVARAGATSYCLESADAHLAGPGGSAAPGRC